PCRQIGHGCAALLVTIAFDDSVTLTSDSPVVRSSVPDAGCANVFWTQVERPPFTIGSAGPKPHPGAVQSCDGPATLVAPSVRAVAVQLAEKRLVAPSGVGPSGTVEFPPPRLSPPHVRFFSTVVPAVSVNVLPQMPPATPVVKSRNELP